MNELKELKKLITLKLAGKIIVGQYPTIDTILKLIMPLIEQFTIRKELESRREGLHDARNICYITKYTKDDIKSEITKVITQLSTELTNKEIK